MRASREERLSVGDRCKKASRSTGPIDRFTHHTSEYESGCGFQMDGER